jgi:hypothetical protein
MYFMLSIFTGVGSVEGRGVGAILGIDVGI